MAYLYYFGLGYPLSPGTMGLVNMSGPCYLGLENMHDPCLLGSDKHARQMDLADCQVHAL